MEKNKRIEASQLPEEMIQHIQSFLSGKEAARTTILAKSWYNAWLTRPNLDFDARDIPRTTAFVKFVKKTMQRYDELNLKIHSFSLMIQCSKPKSIECSDKLSEWTTRALKLGATDFEIEHRGCNVKFLLFPREVLESETLVKLSLSGGRIDLHKVSCSRLKSLILRRMCPSIEDDNLWDIISMCPSIEEFVLSSYQKLVLKPRLGVNDFHKLKVLSLDWVEIGEWFFRDLSSKVPCLKELTLKDCTGYEEIHICSNSLESIDFRHGRMPKLSVKLEVPRIRKFKHSSSCVPTLTFKTTSREWESYIYFLCTDSSWFVELRNFLMELESSKIFLFVDIFISQKAANQHVSHTIGLPKPPMVHKLAFLISAPPSFQSTFLEELFWTCRPNFITLPLYDVKKDFVNLICNILIKEECENGITSSLHDLEEVNVQVSAGTKWTWSRSLPTKALSASAFEGYSDRTVCLQFRWGDNF